MSDSQKIIDNLLDEVRDLKSARKRKDWASPAMLTAYVAVIGSLGTSGKACFDQYAHRQDLVEQTTQRKSIDRVVVRYIGAEIDGVYETLDVYLEALRAVMSTYQRRKFDRYLREHDFGFDTEEFASESVGVAGVTARTEPAHAPRTAVLPDDTLDVLQQAAGSDRESESVDQIVQTKRKLRLK